MCVSGRRRMRCAAHAARPPAQYWACQPGSRNGSAPSSPLKPRKPVAVCTSSSSAITPGLSASAPQAVTVTSLGTGSPSAARASSRWGSHGPPASPACVSLAMTTSGQDGLTSVGGAVQLARIQMHIERADLIGPQRYVVDGLAPCRVTPGRLHLDHRRAGTGQQPSGIRPGDTRRQLQHPHPRQRRRRGSWRIGRIWHRATVSAVIGRGRAKQGFGRVRR